MSLWKRLFGGGAPVEGLTETKPVKMLSYNGFSINATPYKESGEFQTCGVVSKEVDGSLREHRFVRADRFASIDEAAENALRKGRQLIDEQGDRLFS